MMTSRIIFNLIIFLLPRFHIFSSYIHLSSTTFSYIFFFSYMTLMNYLARDILKENILPKLMYELALINEPSIMPSPYTKGAQGPMMMIMTTCNWEWKKRITVIGNGKNPHVDIFGRFALPNTNNKRNSTATGRNHEPTFCCYFSSEQN